MLVVVAIIVLVVSLSLPSVSALWNDRKLSDAEGKIEGMLMNARAQAVGSSEGEHGLLFFLDDKGAQRIVPIVQAEVPDVLPCTMPPLRTNTEVLVCRDAYALAYLDVFVVQNARNVTLPPPLRVVPRYVVNPDGTTDEEKVLTFSDDGTHSELANQDWTTLPSGNNEAQRHRNYFAMVFSANGQLLDRRDVLIQDVDDDGDGKGDLTGLPSSYDHANQVAIVTKYHGKVDPSPPKPPLPLDQTGSTTVAIPYLIVEASGQGASTAQKTTAINFPSVDGMLLYDDAEFRTIAADDAAEARQFILNTGIPLYVSRVTGSIIRGPVGEGETVQ